MSRHLTGLEEVDEASRYKPSQKGCRGPAMALLLVLFLKPMQASPQWSRYNIGSHLVSSQFHRAASSGGQWSNWAAWSACSMTCGGGVSTRDRRCLSRFLGTGVCQGVERQYRACNINEECALGAVDFRAMQCSLFDNRPIRGQPGTFRWVPFHGALNPCELTCLAVGQNFYYSFGRVLDGTRCGLDLTHMCINGQCLEIGCDMLLGSNITKDACRVCGGHNDTCLHFRSTYTSGPSSSSSSTSGRFGYNEVTTIPAGATHIRVIDKSLNYLALMNGHHRYVINGNWVIDWPGEYSVAGTKVLYKRSADNRESMEAVGPTAEALHVMVLLREKNPNIEYEFWFPSERDTAVQLDPSAGHGGIWPAVFFPWRKATAIPTTTTVSTTILSTALPSDRKQRSDSIPAHRWPLRSHSGAHMHLAEQDRSSRIVDPPRRPLLPQPPEPPPPEYCKSCKKVRGRSNKIKQFCQKDFVFQGRVLSKHVVGLETRYDVQVLQTFKSTADLMSREYLWVPNACDCPRLVQHKDYLLMARRHVNFEQTLNRILLEHDSFVRAYRPSEARFLKGLTRRCNRRRHQARPRNSSVG
uniref:ADAMTS-like protein 5 isoform X2 n=1 Tax=Myxine glutinosa TaxID=7769 RepID=UPI00359011E3